MIETELKAMLNEATYHKIKDAFEWDTSKCQTNSYYVSPDNELKRHGITFRIRTIENKHILQIKKHTAKDGALQVSEETEFPIDNIPYEFTEAEVEAKTGIKTSASLIGELKTLRHSYIFSDGVEICLDKSTYLNHTDYEIEIEYTNPVPNELLATLEGLGVDFTKPCKGKFSRFMNRLMG